MYVDSEGTAPLGWKVDGRGRRAMGTKDQVLRMLEDQRDRQVSGARLAEELGVTRNAVWKAV